MHAEFHPLGGGVYCAVSDEHRFGTDGFLLAGFARLRHTDKVLDMGCGAGILSLLSARDRREGSSETPQGPITAVDISREAAELLEQSAEKSGLGDVIRVQRADLRDMDDIVTPGGTDAILCNPPYFKAGSGYLSKGDAAQTARHEQNCTAEDVARAAARYLRWGGALFMCQRPERLVDVLTSLRQYGVEPKRLQWVCQRQGAAPWLFLLEARRGGNPALRVMPHFVVEDENGNWTAPMRGLYRLNEEGRRET